MQLMNNLAKQIMEQDPNKRAGALPERQEESRLEKRLKIKIDASIPLSKLQEDLSRDNNTGLSTGAVATFIMSGFTPMLVAENIMNVIVTDLDTMDGITIPISQNLSAGEVNDDGSLSIQSSKNYNSRDVNFSMYGVYNAATFELRDHSSADLIGYELMKMGYALSEIADVLMFTAFNTAAPVAGTNNNYVGLGKGKFAELEDVFSVMETMGDARLRPRVVVTNFKTWRRLVYSSPVGLPVSNQVDIDRPYSVNIGGIRLIASHNVGANQIYVTDPDELGYLFRHPISNFTYRESGKLVEDIWAYMRMGVAVGQYKSMFRIQEDAAEYPATP